MRQSQAQELRALARVQAPGLGSRACGHRDVSPERKAGSVLTRDCLLDPLQPGVGSVDIQREVVELLLSKASELHFLFTEFLR